MSEKEKRLFTRREFIASAGAVVATGALAACQPLTTAVTTTQEVPTTTTGTTPVTTSQPSNVINVGYSIPLNLSFGVSTNNALSVLLPMFNQKGIVVKGTTYQLNLIIRDDQNTADGGKTNAQQFVSQQNLKHVFYLASTPTLAAFPVTEAAGVLMFSGASVTDYLLPPSKYTFLSSDDYMAKAVKWKFLRDTFPNVKTVGLLEPDSSSGTLDISRCQFIAPKFGFSLPTQNVLMYPTGTTDFTSVATKMATINPDLVVFAATEGDAAIAGQVKALRAAGFTGNIGKTEELDMTQFSGVVPNSAIEGMTGKLGADAVQPVPPDLAAFKAAYIAKYGNFPTIYYSFLDPLFMFRNAVEKAQSFAVSDIAAAIGAGLQWDVLGIPFMNYYREDINLNRPVGICTVNPMGVVHDGKLTLKHAYTAQETFDAEHLVYGVTTTPFTPTSATPTPH